MTPNELFDTNQSLVGWCYKRFINNYNHPHKEDILQEGRLALWQACKKFDESRGIKFSTYATYFIAGRMRQYQRYKCNVIKIPRKAYEGETHLLEELSNTLSLDYNIEHDDGEGVTIGDLIGGPDQYEFITEELVDSFISTIDNPVHRDLMEEYYYNSIWGLLHTTQQELADKYNTSQPTCVRIIKLYNTKFGEFLKDKQQE